jgi:hypothetical protein
VLFYGLRGLCVGRVDQFDRFHFSPSRAFPRALNDVNKPKRLGTRLALVYIHRHKPSYLLLGSRLLPPARGQIQKEGLWHKASTTSHKTKKFYAKTAKCSWLILVRANL